MFTFMQSFNDGDQHGLHFGCRILNEFVCTSENYFTENMIILFIGIRLKLSVTQMCRENGYSMSLSLLKKLIPRLRME